jgi:Ran GTPase-activating protein (RanGAP) involved in mRNA processing and transport
MKGIYEGMTKKQKDDLLKRFIKEFFPISELFKTGFFPKEIKGNYREMAKIICHHFGFETIYQYGAEEISCHISYEGNRPEEDKDFITTIPSIYE